MFLIGKGDFQKPKMIWLIISASTILDIQQLKEEEEGKKKKGMIKERAAEQIE